MFGLPGLRFVPPALRYVPRAEHWGIDRQRTYHPIMLATVSDVFGDPVALHRTYLTEDGEKANVPEAEQKMNLGKLQGAEGEQLLTLKPSVVTAMSYKPAA